MAAIEELTGSVVKAESSGGGLMPGLAAVIHTGNGKYFVKAAPADGPAARLYEREMAVNTALPANILAPRMQHSSRKDGWLVMVFDFLDARDADLSPGSPDLDGVVSALTAIGATRAWDAAPPASTNVTALQDKAAALLGRQPGGQPRVPRAGRTRWALLGGVPNALTGAHGCRAIRPPEPGAKVRIRAPGRWAAVGRGQHGRDEFAVSVASVVLCTGRIAIVDSRLASDEAGGGVVRHR
jgi:hypothetical protein